MLGCCSRATASASVRKRVALVAAGVAAAQDHLEGDEAVEAELAGLVDDAHAAAAQLAQHLVAGDGRRRKGGRASGRSSAWRGGRRSNAWPPGPRWASGRSGWRRRLPPRRKRKTAGRRAEWQITCAVPLWKCLKMRPAYRVAPQSARKKVLWRRTVHCGTGGRTANRRTRSCGRGRVSRSSRNPPRGRRGVRPAVGQSSPASSVAMWANKPSSSSVTSSTRRQCWCSAPTKSSSGRTRPSWSRRIRAVTSPRGAVSSTSHSRRCCQACSSSSTAPWTLRPSNLPPSAASGSYLLFVAST